MKQILLLVLSFLFMAAGVYHFVKPEMYRKIMPPWLPWPDALILWSGVAELLLGLPLLFPVTRQLAAWGLIALLIAVFPANIQMMLNYLHRHHPQLWLAILRLPLQFVLIWWVYQYTSKPV
jgi:uncharacterized membrane protein